MEEKGADEKLRELRTKHVRVVSSCRTPEQIQVAQAWSRLAIKRMTYIALANLNNKRK